MPKIISECISSRLWDTCNADIERKKHMWAGGKSKKAFLKL